MLIKKAIEGIMKIKNRTFLKSLNPCGIDCVYLSKSSAWVPPWLDSVYFKFQRELEKLFGPPIIYEPAPKKISWNYEKLVEQGIEERRTIENLKTAKMASKKR